MPEHVRRELEKAGMIVEAEPQSSDVEIQIGDMFYFTAFTDLDSERSYTEGTPTPIPFSKIVGYGETLGLDSEEIQDLAFIIRKVDNAHMKNAIEARKKVMENASKNTQGVRKPNAGNSKAGRRGR